MLRGKWAGGSDPQQVRDKHFMQTELTGVLLGEDTLDLEAIHSASYLRIVNNFTAICNFGPQQENERAYNIYHN